LKSAIVCALAAVSAGSASATEVRRIDDTVSVQVFSGDDADSGVLAFDPRDEGLVAVGNYRRGVALVDLQTMAVAWRAEVNRFDDDPLVFSPDGRVIATVDGGKLSFLDIYTGARLASYEVTVQPYAPPQPYSIGQPERFCFSRDGTLMIVASINQLVVADRATGRAVQPFWDFDTSVLMDTKDVQFSPDERFVYLITSRRLYALNIATGALARVTELDLILGLELGSDSNPEVVRITGDGAYSALALGHFVYVVDNAAERLVRRFLASSERINDIRFTADQCCVLVAASDGSSRVYDIATGEQVTRLDDTRSSQDRTRLAAVAAPSRFDVVVTTDVHGVLRAWRP
jgi:WD40 repeat protein